MPSQSLGVDSGVMVYGVDTFLGWRKVGSDEHDESTNITRLATETRTAFLRIRRMS